MWEACLSQPSMPAGVFHKFFTSQCFLPHTTIPLSGAKLHAVLTLQPILFGTVSHGAVTEALALPTGFLLTLPECPG